MRRYAIILGACFVVFFASCHKIEEPIRFSILGDSYSTFEGYVNPESNDVWYHYPPDNYNDVTEVNQMWWWQLVDSIGWQLEKNNSFSGSFICNMDYVNYYGAHSFLRRMDDLGNPNVIFVFGGTNDVVFHAPLGDFVFEDWTEEQLCTFRPALAYLFFELKKRYSQAKLYFMLDLSLDDAFIAATHRIAQYYDVQCVDLHDIEKYWNHPTIAGQTTIAQQVLNALALDGFIF